MMPADAKGSARPMPVMPVKNDSPPAGNEYLLSFHSTHDGINVKMRLRNRCRFTILPTPREIHASCGISLRMDAEAFGFACEVLDELKLGCDRVILHRVVHDGPAVRYLPCER